MPIRDNAHCRCEPFGFFALKIQLGAKRSVWGEPVFLQIVEADRLSVFIRLLEIGNTQRLSF